MLPYETNAFNLPKNGQKTKAEESVVIAPDVASVLWPNVA
jgi:hypothetical protein